MYLSCTPVALLLSRAPLPKVGDCDSRMPQRRRDAVRRAWRAALHVLRPRRALLRPPAARVVHFLAPLSECRADRLFLWRRDRSGGDCRRAAALALSLTRVSTGTRAHATCVSVAAASLDSCALPPSLACTGPARRFALHQGFTAVFGVFFVPLPEELTQLSLCSALAHPASGAAAVIRWRESASVSRLQS